MAMATPAANPGPALANRSAARVASRYSLDPGRAADDRSHPVARESERRESIGVLHPAHGSVTWGSGDDTSCQPGQKRSLMGHTIGPRRVAR